MTRRRLSSGRLNNRPNISLDNADLAEIQAEAKRLDAPLSWVVQQAWRIARGHIQAEGDAIVAARAALAAPSSAQPQTSSAPAAPQSPRAARPPERRAAPAPESPTQEATTCPPARPAEPLDIQARELWPWGEPTM